MKTADMKVADLIPYEFNNKVHDSEQVNRIANSIREFWFTQPLVVDQNNVVIIGHGRLLAAIKLGLETVPVLKIENLTETQIKKLRILDNKLNESERDNENLKLELKDLDYDLSVWDLELKAEDLFDELELEEMEDETEVQEIDTPEVEEAKVVQESDFFFLWRHKLLCWDSTKRKDVNILMWWELADLLLTDPPYNVDYESNWKKIMNDNMQTDLFYQFLFYAFDNAYNNIRDWASFYVRHASREVINFQTALENTWLVVKQQLIRNKNSLVLWRQDYQWKHEPCLYWWKDTWTHKWYWWRAESTVIDRDKPTKSEEHPTMKPVWLMDYQIKNSTKKSDLVLDLFGWSGTTLIACEQNGRRCNMMELDPKYCEVIIKRFHQLNPTAEIKCVNRDVDLTVLFDEE